MVKQRVEGPTLLEIDLNKRKKGNLNKKERGNCLRCILEELIPLGLASKHDVAALVLELEQDFR